MSKYRVAYVDNRGTADSPFGFVGLTKGKHVVGRVGFGAHRDNPKPLAIWACGQTPDDIGPLDAVRIKDTLAKAFPHLAEGREP